MLIRPFDHNKDYETVQSWLHQRDSLPQSLPKHGFIAIQHGEPVACGFFRELETDYVLADSFITNPSKPSQIRNLALTKLFDKMIKVAKHFNRKGILAFSVEDSIISRASKHGFVTLPHQIISLGL